MNLLIVGASRGLGAAFAQGLPAAGDRVWMVSRQPPQFPDPADGVQRLWIEADMAAADGVPRIVAALGDGAIDGLIYNVGIWEKTAFSDAYRFDQVSPLEHQRILQVNLGAAIDCVQAVLPHLRRSRQARVIFISSISGVENVGSPEVGYVASKFGLRGVTHALRETLRPEGIPVSCLNPGMIATEIPYEAGIDAVLAAFHQSQIPVQDVVAMVGCILSLSPAACVKEIHMPALADTWA